MGGTAAQPSCERDAMNSATQQVRMAVNRASSPGAMAAAPPAPAPAAPAPAEEAAAAPAAAAPAAATVTTRTVTNGPIPDTPENRARFGGPNSAGGRRTAPSGN
jgi:hypothetical protein